MAYKTLVKYTNGQIMVSGIRNKFKQPIYKNFDTAMTKEILFEVNSPGCHWVYCHQQLIIFVQAIVVSDCGGSNVGLGNS